MSSVATPSRPVVALIKRHPLALFWALAWSTSWLHFYTEADDPLGLRHLLFFGPLLGGALITAALEGQMGLDNYLRRMVRWRVGIQWYAAALLLPLLLRLAALGLNLAAGARLSAGLAHPAWADLLSGFLLQFFIISLGEDPGLIGFALPRLMARRTALASALLLGVFHSLMYLPLYLTGQDQLTTVPIVIAGAVLVTWLFNRSGGSVLIAMLLHASVNLSADYFGTVVSGSAAAWQPIWMMLVFIGLAVLLVALEGPELGRRRGTSPAVSAGRQPAPAE